MSHKNSSGAHVPPSSNRSHPTQEQLDHRLNIMEIRAITNPDPSNSSSLTNHSSSCDNPMAIELICIDTDNFRRYHTFHAGKYLLPNDEQEQDRLDFLHHVILRATQKLIHVPLGLTARLLDLGCGTGIWAKDLARVFPNVSVVGVDISSIQPSEGPPNCEFYAPFDFEYPWGLTNAWDVIRLQMSSGSVGDWPQLYRQIFEKLHTGGWFEQVEVDYEPRCINGGKALFYWYQNLKRATDANARPIHHQCDLTVNLLQDAGFVDVSHKQIILPLNQWHPASQEQNLGRWYGRAVFDSIEPLTLAPFTRILRWPPQKIQSLINEVKQELCDPGVQGFQVLHVYTAQKQATPKPTTAESTTHPLLPEIQFTSTQLIA